MFFLFLYSITIYKREMRKAKGREQRAHRHTLTSVDNKPGLGDREGLGPKYVTTSTSSRVFLHCKNVPKPATRFQTADAPPPCACLSVFGWAFGGVHVAASQRIPWRLCLNGLGIAHPMQNRAPADATRALSAHAELCGSGKHASSSHGVCRGGRTTRSGGLLPT